MVARHPIGQEPRGWVRLGEAVATVAHVEGVGVPPILAPLVGGEHSDGAAAHPAEAVGAGALNISPAGGRTIPSGANY